jgi:hypothetical protein
MESYAHSKLRDLCASPACDRQGTAAPHLYSLMRGCPSAPSFTRPHFEKKVAISASLVSKGRPETYTLVLFFSSNQPWWVGCWFVAGQNVVAAGVMTLVRERQQAGISAAPHLVLLLLVLLLGRLLLGHLLLVVLNNGVALALRIGGGWW